MANKSCLNSLNKIRPVITHTGRDLHVAKCHSNKLPMS